ncbi:MAG: AAA family ATPase [Planctomycetota bacterium]
MTLTALRIANFKAFAAAQRVPLRPITLVYGANSAGKSSILHALALAHHAVETGELDTQRTQIGGESIDLGGFRQYVHRRERERQMELTFEIDPGCISGRVAELLRSARGVAVELAIGAGFASEQRTLFGGLDRVLDPVGGARVERFAIEVDGAPLLSMSARAGGLLRLDRLDHGHPVFRELFRGLLMLATTTQEVLADDFAALGEVVDGLVPGITARAGGLFPRIEEESSGGEADRQREEAFVPVSRGRRQEDLARAARLFLPKALRELVGGLGMSLEEEIRRLRYLGPLRSYPPRHLASSQHHDPNWFAGGGYAWDVVRTREDIRRRVNAWLGDASRLKTPYELEVRDLLPAPAVAGELPAKLGKALHDLAAALLGRLHGDERAELTALASDVAEHLAELDPDDPDDTVPEVEDLVTATANPEELSERWTGEMVESRPEALQDLVLIDKRTGTPVSHRDVGIGVSQALPVLVSAYASRGKLLAIEQPEIHLHPALQAELGDVFLGAALGEGGNTLLIESHSEHLLLRIMRRMRETNDGRLPEGVPAVRPEHVMVLFVEPDGPKSIVREMPLNERGELVKAWPGGFFEEGLREVS